VTLRGAVCVAGTTPAGPPSSASSRSTSRDAKLNASRAAVNGSSPSSIISAVLRPKTTAR
jgi:hypothetical protein